jgi:hypothetical protein
MPAYEVLAVSEPAATPEKLLGACIELPEAGLTAGVLTLHVAGWALGRESAATAVEVLYQPAPGTARPGPERVIRVMPIRGSRDDVTAAFPQVDPGIDCQFESLVGVLGMTPEFELRLRVALADGSRAEIGSVRVRREPLRTGYEPRFAPIVLSGLGRSGSTWLMALLAAHPEVVVYREFPYESRPIRYWMQALKVLAEPSNIVQSAHPDTFQNDLWWTGHNPFHDTRVASTPVHNEWFAREYVERLATFFQRSADDWYGLLAQTQGQPGARRFAEKHLWPNYIPVLMRELYPSLKEVFLVRDFRDMTLSILSFDEKRGFAGFGRVEGSTDEDYVRTVLKPAAQGLMNSWRTRGADSHLVRYEDLIAEPRAKLAALFEYLELRADHPTLDAVLASAESDSDEVRDHRTSVGADDSIGRWRREGDEEFRAFCTETFAEELAAFGYEDQS